MDDEVGVRLINELHIMNFLKFLELRGNKKFVLSDTTKLYREYIEFKEIVWKE